MTVVVKGQMVLRDPETEEEVVIKAKSFDFQPVDGSERGMGQEITHEAEVEVEVGDNTHTVTVHVYEYPVGCLNLVQTETGDLEIVQDLKIDIILDDEGDDED